MRNDPPDDVPFQRLLFTLPHTPCALIIPLFAPIEEPILTLTVKTTWQ